MAESIFRGTTICAVRKNGECAMAGDGQVTMGQQTVMKAHAHKVRRIYNGKVVVGFAGSVADAFALSEKFEEKLTQFSGNLPRAAVELAQDWRMDKAMRKLEAMLLCADKDNLLLVSGTGEGNFSPNAAITREQLAAMLANYSAYKGEDVSARADLSGYSDVESISSWANDTMQWAVAEGLISGVTTDELQPQGNATRAQLAAILERFLSK